MKTNQLVIFLTIVLSVYSLANIYIYLKGYHAITTFQNNRILYLAVFFILASVFVAGKILETRHSSVLSDVLNIIGGFWMAFILYGFLFLFLSDIIYAILRIAGILSGDNILLYRKWSYLSTLLVSFLLISGGFLNAIFPHVKNYTVEIEKTAGDTKELRIAAVSDIHLGSVIRKRSIRKLSEMLKNIKPDVVLLLGDIVDGEIGPVLRGDLLKYFTCPKCGDGTYAITGNHEFIGGAGRTIPYIESKGIRILKDELVTIEGGIQIAGRLDRDSRRFYGVDRKPLDEIVRNADKSRPIILLDHQPFDLEDAVKNGIDLQLSGHTHNGQLWPLNIITRKMYEVSYGFKKKGNTHIIVSSGYGLWGPRVRSGSRSEVLSILLKFTGSSESL